MRTRRGGPSWIWWLAGLLAYLIAGRPTWAPPALDPEDVRRWSPRDDPADMTVRDLRRLPALGNRRATAAVEARWRAAPGDEVRWSDVWGIGEVTEERVVEALREMGVSERLIRR